MSDFLLWSSWWIPFYGLLGALFTLPWSLGIIRRSGPRPAAYINLVMTAIAFFHGSFAFWHSWGHPPQQLIFQWLQVADLNLTLTIQQSPISLGALELVAGISLLVQIYALGYLEKIGRWRAFMD